MDPRASALLQTKTRDNGTRRMEKLTEANHATATYSLEHSASAHMTNYYMCLLCIKNKCSFPEHHVHPYNKVQAGGNMAGGDVRSTTKFAHE
jgi:hypothetical protein